MGWLTSGGAAPVAVNEASSLKGASRSFLPAANAGVAQAAPVYVHRKRGCCGDGAMAEFLRSFKMISVGEPGDRPWFNFLLVLVPLAIISRFAHWPEAAQFILALLAMIPLAERLGYTTESLADHTNDTIGGLMNATMGNLPELIIALFALQDGLLRVVQTSLLGSILSNLLLVMGTAYLVGGIKHSEQTFNKLQTHTGAGLLVLAMMCILLPGVLDATNTEALDGVSSTTLSRIVSIAMIVTYIALMFFQLKTHAYLFAGLEDESTPKPAAAAGSSASSSSAVASSAADALERGRAAEDGRSGSMASTSGLVDSEAGKRIKTSRISRDSVDAGAGGAEPMEAMEAEEEEEPPLSVFSSIFWMAVVAGFIAGLSEILVGSLQVFADQTGIPESFVSTIMLPIAGNAAEHASAIIFAAKNRLDISLGVAIGSSTQIALFVTPFCVLVGWAVGQPLDLNFQVFETVVVFITVIMTGFVNMEGRSNWLQGLLLIMAYFAVAAAFLLHVQAGDNPA